MVILKRFILTALLVYSLPQEITDEYTNAVADALYLTEGADKAKVKYGLIFDSYCEQEPGFCRYIAKISIEKNWQRWQRSDKKNSFLKHMGLRYCPPSVDPIGHANWVRNMRFFVEDKHGTRIKS